jgi:hypothetical protein
MMTKKTKRQPGIIRIDGQSCFRFRRFTARGRLAHERPLVHEVKITLYENLVTISVIGSLSRHSHAIESDDPAVLAHWNEVTRLLVQTVLPEIDHEPFNAA